MITPKDLAEYVKICRKYGIIALEIEGLKMSILEEPEEPQTPLPQGSSNIPPQYTDEEILAWSTGSLGK